MSDDTQKRKAFGTIVIINDSMSPIPGTEEGAIRSFANMTAHGVRQMTFDQYATTLHR